MHSKVHSRPSGFLFVVIVLAIAIVLVVSCENLALAQERSPEPDSYVALLKVVQCQPHMIIRVHNRSSEDMQRPGNFLWEGQSQMGTIPPIPAGFSWYDEHPTARSYFLVTYDNVTGVPFAQTVGCYQMFLPAVKKHE